MPTNEPKLVIHEILRRLAEADFVGELTERETANYIVLRFSRKKALGKGFEMLVHKQLDMFEHKEALGVQAKAGLDRIDAQLPTAESPVIKTLDVDQA